MSMRGSLCHIFEAIGPYNAIGRVAATGVRVALEAGFKVTVVAKYLHESLRSDVEWIRLYVPPRLYFVQWTTAGHFIRRALGTRKFDVIHSHQPQAASLSDVFQCHFLTRAAVERNCLDERKNMRARFNRAQHRGALYFEDRCFRRWNPATWMLYDSAMTRDEFHRLYGKCPKEDVLVYDFPPLKIAREEERAAARKRIFGNETPAIVLGYLGGLHERKGYKRLIAALRGQRDIHLLIGGSYTENYCPPELKGHVRSVGLVSDTATFYAACDVLAVPSLFEPFGLVACEASARGTPVIATPEVGALPHLLEFSAGECWNPAEPLAPLVRHMCANRNAYLAGITRMAAALSVERYGERLLNVYEAVMSRENLALESR
jgi:glycosyltransferase involved in cell wall biosynthesis